MLMAKRQGDIMSEKMFIVGLALGMIGGALIATNSREARQMVYKGQRKVRKTAEKLSNCDCDCDCECENEEE